MFSKKLRSVLSGLLIISCVCLLSGCFKNKVLVKVKKDGSGTIVVTQIFGAKMVKIVDEQKKKSGQTGGPGLINKTQIEMAAKKFGQNVKFKKMKELNKADGSKGYIALYTFADIKDVKIPFNVMPNAKGSDITFDFQVDKKGISKLTVNLEKIDKSAVSGDDRKEYPPHPQSAKDLQGLKQMKAMAGNPFNLSEKDSKEEMFKKMFADMSSSIAIETTGTVVKSNASYPSKKKASRFTIVDINFNKLMKSKKFLYNLSEDKVKGAAQMLPLMSACSEGFTYDNQGEIVVEFK